MSLLLCFSVKMSSQIMNLWSWIFGFNSFHSWSNFLKFSCFHVIKRFDVFFSIFALVKCLVFLNLCSFSRWLRYSIKFRNQVLSIFLLLFQFRCHICFLWCTVRNSISFSIFVSKLGRRFRGSLLGCSLSLSRISSYILSFLNNRLLVSFFLDLYLFILCNFFLVFSHFWTSLLCNNNWFWCGHFGAIFLYLAYLLHNRYRLLLLWYILVLRLLRNRLLALENGFRLSFELRMKLNSSQFLLFILIKRFLWLLFAIVIILLLIISRLNILLFDSL